jgi:hypothetical protein
MLKLSVMILSHVDVDKVSLKVPAALSAVLLNR